MDVLSQAVLGASFSQSFAKDKSKQLTAMLIGALAGMAPDLDVLIYSTDDPLLFLEFHRQFTHSLFFIPFGALLCALVFYPFIKNKLTFSHIYLFSIFGFATHGLLDACTSYGTQLFWPFTNARIAWDIVSIIDPFFTIPILVGVVFSVYKKNHIYARSVFVYAIVFLCLGFVQKQRAEDVLYDLAQQRGHQAERIIVKPSFANRHVWKMIYEDNGRYYVDAVKLLWNKEVITGSSIEKLNISRDLPWLSKSSQQAKDIERFRWFSDDFLAVNLNDPKVIIDVRYSLLPNEINMMWGIGLDKNKDAGAHTSFMVNTELDKETRKKFVEILF